LFAWALRCELVLDVVGLAWVERHAHAAVVVLVEHVRRALWQVAGGLRGRDEGTRGGAVSRPVLRRGHELPALAGFPPLVVQLFL
jgi:hypothetical protein